MGPSTQERSAESPAEHNGSRGGLRMTHGGSHPTPSSRAALASNRLPAPDEKPAQSLLQERKSSRLECTRAATTRRRAPSEAPPAGGGAWGEPRERAPSKVAARERREEHDETGRMGGRAP